jgi:hypothetical protein
MNAHLLYALPLAVLIALPAAASSQHLLADDFVYPVADSIEGVSQWEENTTTPYKIRIVSPGLYFPGHVGSGVGNAVFLSNMPGGDVVKRVIPVTNSGHIYLSFLLEVDSLTESATAGNVTALDQAGGPTNHSAKAYIRRVSPTSFNLGIVKVSSAAVYDGQVYGTDTTFLVVVKYTWTPGATTNDTARIFVFRSAVPTAEPEAGAFNASGTDAIDAGEVIITNAYAQSGLAGSPVRIDAIRVGTTWEGTLFSAVGNAPEDLPERFTLEQNYPNPFNPSTTIEYAIPHSGLVTLRVYNVLGEEIATLFDDTQPAGTFTAKWDASGIPSGVYFYRLTAGEYIQTRKMVLLR